MNKSGPSIKRVKIPAIPTPTEARKAAELWLDFFQAALVELIEPSSTKHVPWEVASKAADYANCALDAFEKRWPGVKLRD